MAAFPVLARDADPNYVAGLRRDYADRVTFGSEYAREVAESFELDCRSRDGRTLPLMHVFFAKMKQATDLTLIVTVVNRGEDIRVYDRWTLPNGQRFEQLAYEINKRGVLQIRDGSPPDALYKACFGSHGPIWKMEGTAAPAATRASAAAASSAGPN